MRSSPRRGVLAPHRSNGPFGILTLAALVMIACRQDGTAPAAGPVAAERSEVTVASALVVSGATVELRLTTKDAAGRLVRTGGRAALFQATGGTSSGIVGPTVDRGDGTYVATFRGVGAGTPTTVGATIDGNPVTRPLPTVRVRPGPLSKAKSLIRVRPRTIEVGRQATIEFFARDSVGNDQDTGGLRVRFTTSGGLAKGTIGPVTDHGDGRYSAVFTATEIGTPIGVQPVVNDDTLTTARPTLSVARGVSAGHSTLSLSSASVSVNAALTITLGVRDSAGVARTSGGESVAFRVLTSVASGQGTISATTDHDDGTYTATFTATRSGAAVGITATLNGVPVSGAPPMVTILGIPVAPQRSTVSVSRDVIQSGQSATLTARIRDVNGDLVSRAGLSVRFLLGTGGTSAGTVGPTEDHGDGTYSAAFNATRAGTPVAVGATVGDSTRIEMLDSLGVSHLPTITVSPGPAAAGSSQLLVTPAQVNVGDSAVIRVLVRDAFGNVVGRGGRSVTLRRDGGPGVSVGRIGPTVDHSDGTYSARYLADSAGAPDTIRASVDGAPVTSGVATVTVKATCTAGPVSGAASVISVNDVTPLRAPVKHVTLPSGVTTTLTLEARDGSGCSVKAPLVALFSTTGGTSTGVLGPTVDHGDGTYTATFTGHTAGTATTIRATVNGTPVESPPVTVAVIPGDISTQTSKIVDSLSTVSVGDSVVVTLLERDAAGNALVQHTGHVVVFAVVGDTTRARIAATRRNPDGTYSATYRAVAATAAGLPDIIIARIDGTPVAHVAKVTAVP